MNEDVALITAEEVERVESVQDSKEDKLSSAGDSEEDKSNSVGTKTDGELIEKLLPGVYPVIVEYFNLQEKLLMLMSVHFTIVKQVFLSVCGSYSEIHIECAKQSVDLEAVTHLKNFFHFMVTIAITTDEVEGRVDTVGNLEEDKSRSFGGSEGEENGPRVQQEVREIVKSECLAL